MITNYNTGPVRDRWDELLDGLLSLEAAASRAEVDLGRLRAATADGKLIVVKDRTDQPVYPGCQFRHGWPPESLVEAWRTVAEAAISPWTACSWLVAADDALNGATPVDFAHRGSPARLLTVARQEAGRLAR